MDKTYNMIENCICGKELRRYVQEFKFGQIPQYTKEDLTPHFCEDCDKIYGDAQRKLMETY